MLLRLSAVPRRTRRRLMTAAGITMILGLACLKTLDESRIDANNPSGGAGGQGGSGGSPSAGSGGTAGSDAGGGDAPLDSSDAANDADDGGPKDAGPDATFEPHDPSKYPVTTLAGAQPTSMALAADEQFVFRVELDAPNVAVLKYPVGGGAGVPLNATDVSGALSITAPPGSLFVFIGARVGVTDEGAALRLLKAPMGLNPPEVLSTPATVGRIAGGYATATSPFEYFFNARTSSSGQPHVMRVGLTTSDTVSTTVYSSESGNETGGDISVSSGCVYWISKGDVWVAKRTQGARSAAAALQTGDITHLATDDTHLFFSRSNGEIYARPLFGASCTAGSTPDESLITSGFSGIGGMVAREGRVAWTAIGSDLGGGGLFSSSVSRDIVQQAPSGNNPGALAVNSMSYFYGTQSGEIRRVPRLAQ